MARPRATEAVVLVGGLGTRLREVVSDVPKPLAPVAGRPFLAWILDHLVENGIERIILAAGYKADLVEAAIGREWRGKAVDYSIETEPLGTGGALRQAVGMLRGHGVHVLNGDTYLAYSMPGLEQETHEAGALVGMALAVLDDTARYGSVLVRDGWVVDFAEKGRSGAGLVNAGYYYLADESLATLPRETAFSLEQTWLPALVQAGKVAGYARTDRFIDIGVPADYRHAQSVFSA